MAAGSKTTTALLAFIVSLPLALRKDAGDHVQ